MAFYILLFIYLLLVCFLMYWLTRLVVWLVGKLFRLSVWILRNLLVLMGRGLHRLGTAIMGGIRGRNP